ncbi:MAG: hypothetical protein JSU66_13975 [Deltaproteobacteria bacterium]|nr:MAG: hypothetical protein JSU66_13975 [Deltaproteobacteria bacterium]
MTGRTSRRRIAASLLAASVFSVPGLVLLHGHGTAVMGPAPRDAAVDVAAERAIGSAPTVCPVCETASQSRLALRAQTCAGLVCPRGVAEPRPPVAPGKGTLERDARRPRGPPHLS